MSNTIKFSQFPNLGNLAPGDTVVGLNTGENAAFNNNNALFYASGTISAAQLLALNSTPIQIIPSPSGDTIICVTSITAEFIAGDTAFTASADQSVIMCYETPAFTSIFENLVSNEILTGLDNAISLGAPIQIVSQPETGIINSGVYIYNPISTEMTLGNGELNYWVWYTIANLA